MILLFSRLCFAFILLVPTGFSLSPDSLFQNEYLESEKILSNQYFHSSSISQPQLSSVVAETVLQDPKQLLREDFVIPKYFNNAVNFWFSIYTHFSSHQMVIHDRDQLNLIYDILDFSDLLISPVNQYVQRNIQSSVADDKIRLIRKTLIHLSRSPYSKKASAVKIRTIIKSSNITMPSSTRKLHKFYMSLAQNIRVQTGQRDMIFRGIIESLPYLKFFNYYLKLFDLPDELLALPFLESSFNPRAISHVGASGAWQIMPFIAEKMLPYDRLVDGRSNLFLSSLSAFHLLKQNYRILKRWDLAISAYNSGTKHLLRARRQLKKHYKDPSLSIILQKYSHPHLGFASVNFYAEFLALAHILKYKEIIFPLKGTSQHVQNYAHTISIYLSHCKITPDSFFKQFEQTFPQLSELNLHFKQTAHTYPAGSIVITNFELNDPTFQKVTNELILENFPKNWKKFKKDYKCSNK